MKTQTLALLWLVAICVTWTVPLCETAEPSEVNGVFAEENSGVERSDEDTYNPKSGQIGREETVEPSENGGVETELSSFANGNSEMEIPAGALPRQEDLNDQNYKELEDEVQTEYSRSRKCKVISVFPCPKCIAC